MGAAVIERPDELEAIEGELMDTPADDAGMPEGEPGQQAQEFIGAEHAAALCANVFRVIAARRGEHWQLRAEEASALGGALDAVLAKHIPAGAERYGPEIALLSVATAIILPRMQAGAGGDGGNGEA